ncbi:MAG: YitT family protein [Bacilli bacterium]|nr:YitT family protein [Bacilli bacterium]
MLKYKKYINLIIGVLIESLGFSLFLEPNNLSATDVSGLAVIFHKLYNVNIALFVLIGNLLLIIVSFIFLGKKKTLKTILGSLLLPFFIYVEEMFVYMIDFSQIDVMLLAILGGVFVGIGNGLIFRSGYTSGGTDIIEDIFTKYFHMSLGKSIMFVDGFVVLAGGLAFGIEPMIYSMLALFMMSTFSNRKLIGIDEDKIMLITTKNKKQIIDFMTTHYQYGITIMDAEGAFTKTESDFIMCSVSSKNYYKIKKSLKKEDPTSFIIVLNSYDTNYINKDYRHSAKVN